MFSGKAAYVQSARELGAFYFCWRYRWFCADVSETARALPLHRAYRFNQLAHPEAAP
jgi:hypothetical protein